MPEYVLMLMSALSYPSILTLIRAMMKPLVNVIFLCFQLNISGFHRFAHIIRYLVTQSLDAQNNLNPSLIMLTLVRMGMRERVSF